MFGIFGSVLCSAGPGLPRPSIIIYLFFLLQVQVQGVLVVGWLGLLALFAVYSS